MDLKAIEARRAAEKRGICLWLAALEQAGFVYESAMSAIPAELREHQDELNDQLLMQFDPRQYVAASLEEAGISK